MGHFYFLLGLGGLLLLALILSLHRRFGRRARWPYLADEALFSPPQRAFLAVLERALGPDYRVYGRVRVAEVIGVRRRLDRAARRRAFARLGDRQFDFLVCRAGSGAIACAVNLVPRSRMGRAVRPDTLDRVCVAAGLPFVRLREADDYLEAELVQRIHAAIAALRPSARAPAPPAVPRAVPAGPAAQEVRHSLSEVSVDDAREPRLRPVRARPRAVDPTPTPVPPVAAAPTPTATTAPASAPRIEPTLSAAGDLDPEPTFHIDEGLDHEDDRPARRRRF
ncbi:DUF2726 domain-containing protein [uncultured Thiodictyon sp.]|uniref:DUF2726 domain-containing protein n=1 Tax=uncultured Thiodictyon sp. TaxID=1846217 RepID=UPI0025E0BE55|nr:DUF2726 domain-containing protein [uncultured Thiodictyon sp.]